MSTLLDSFASAFDALPHREAAGLGAARRSALDSVLQDGLPGTRSERWKYTPLRAFERRAFAPVAQATAIDTTVLAGIPAPRLVFVNGCFEAGHSDLTGVPAGVSVRPLSHLLEAGDARAVNFLARRFDRTDEVFARVNAALAGEGV